MTTQTKVVAMLAAALVGALAAFPPRMSSTAQFADVPCGFVFGNVNLATVVVREGHYGSDPMTTRIVCHVDLARLAVESIVVLSVATVIALFLQLRSIKPPEKAE